MNSADFVEKAQYKENGEDLSRPGKDIGKAANSDNVQSRLAKARKILSEKRKQHPGSTSEEVKATWRSNVAKARLRVEQNRTSRRRERERETK